MTTWLLDTGPLVACLDAGDGHHARARAALGPFRGRLVTTGAVVTEAMHFLSEHPEGALRLVDFLELARVDIWDCFETGKLRDAAQLMQRYADTPMDFADATLVLLAEEGGLRDILTFDVRGFRTFRPRNGRAFRLVPTPG